MLDCSILCFIFHRKHEWSIPDFRYMKYFFFSPLWIIFHRAYCISHNLFELTFWSFLWGIHTLLFLFCLLSWCENKGSWWVAGAWARFTASWHTVHRSLFGSGWMLREAICIMMLYLAAASIIISRETSSRALSLSEESAEDGGHWVMHEAVLLYMLLLHYWFFTIFS